MREHHINNNPWAEKLEQVSLPDAGEAKHKMLLLLDAEMPPPRRNQWGLLPILLLLLLTGVCNCPGRLSTSKPIAHRPAAGNPAGVSFLPGNDPSHTGLPGGNGAVAAYGSNKSDWPAGRIDVADGVNGKRTTPAYARRFNTKRHRVVKHRPGKRGRQVVAHAGDGDDTAVAAVDRQQKKAGSDTPVAASATRVPAADTTAGRPPDTTRIKINITEDSTIKKPEEEEESGLAFAIGFNQAIPPGGLGDIGQRPGSGNSILGNYVPVPQLRYHYNEKWYMQFEVAVHSPQYTRPILLRQQFDSLAHNSVYLKKLFYLQLPVSLYYSPFENCYAGAGIQLGFLNNAFGLFETRTTGQNAGVVSKIQSLRADSLSLYPELEGVDLQWFADINYHWKKLSAGMRFSNGFSPFINMPVGTMAKATTHSLQLYLRYTLWRLPGKKSAVK